MEHRGRSCVPMADAGSPNPGAERFGFASGPTPRHATAAGTEASAAGVVMQRWPPTYGPLSGRQEARGCGGCSWRQRLLAARARQQRKRGSAAALLDQVEKHQCLHAAGRCPVCGGGLSPARGESVRPRASTNAPRRLRAPGGRPDHATVWKIHDRTLEQIDSKRPQPF